MNAAPRKSKNNAPTRRHRAPRLRLLVQNASGTRAPATHAQLRRWASAALDADARLTLRLVAEEEARALNRTYRGRDYATNVLSFGYSAPAAAKEISGDLVLCAPVIAREARAQSKTLRAHLAHLIVHGVLHLQGLDHQRAAEAEAMEAEERRILARLGFSDPYRDVAVSVHG